jgi:hypothetical protein
LEVPASDVQSVATGGPHLPGVPAWPMTAPTSGPTKVTEVGLKAAGTGASEPVADSADAAVEFGDGAVCVPGRRPRVAGFAVDPLDDVAAVLLARPGRRFGTSRGRLTAAATMIAAATADAAALVAFRRRARRRIRSKAPGGGGSGSTSPCSQASIRS